MNKPNFFIVGAPKCGTTALSEYLRTHPNIFMSQPKEPHYFAEDFPKYRHVNTLEKYLSLFKDASEHCLAVGEASAIYLYSEIAIRNIYNFNHEAKIIVMLRNPIQQVYSFHSELVFNKDEREKNFIAAWNLQKDRKKGIGIPDSCRDKKILQYSAIAKFGEQLDKLFNIYPSHQIKVILFEDFTHSTKQVYEEVLAFLEVPSDKRENFPRINANKVNKIDWLSKFTERPPRSLVNIAMVSKNLLGLKKLGIISKIRMSNTKVTTRPTLSANFRAELINEFRDDIKKLSQIIDKDLSHWMV